MVSAIKLCIQNLLLKNNLCLIKNRYELQGYIRKADFL